LDPTILINAYDSEEKEKNENTPKNTNKQQLSLETKNRKRRGTGARELLWRGKVTAKRQLKADHPLTAKATKPKIYPKMQR
jgi:hypothetical protein